MIDEQERVLSTTRPRGTPEKNDASNPRWWPSLFELLRLRAEESPGRSFYVRNGRGVQEFRTLAQLLSSSLRVAYALRERGVGTGEPVLLAQPTGFEFLSTFFGLQAVGAIPIPLGWPGGADLLRGPANMARWRRLASRYGARVLICGALEGRTILPPHPLELVIDQAQLLEGVATRVEFEAHQTGPADIAYIQSTSGTTGAPRGVRLTQEGIYASVEAIGQRIEARDDDILVSWLPMDNIMGLVGVVFFALHWNIRPVLMPPERFLAHPEDWFWAISDHRATLSLAPNFSFNFCVRRCNESELNGLDLSSWRIAMNGSEPVRAQHMQAFAKRFHQYGLKDHILMPVYGLSEATLGVSFHNAARPIEIEGINRRDLEWEGVATPLPPQGAARPSERMHVVSVGRPLESLQLRIVDEQTGKPLGERKLGEIAIAGPNVAAGYVAATLPGEQTDQERLPTRFEDGWLRTGDLGFLADGKLYFITRASERILLKSGRSIFPEEVELFVDAVDGVRAGSTAVFAAPGEPAADEEVGVVVVFEVQPGADAEEIKSTIRPLLKTHLELEPAQIIEMPARTIPKTATGKVRRHHSRRLMADGLLGKSAVSPFHPRRLQRGLRDLGDALGGAGITLVRRTQNLFQKN